MTIKLAMLWGGREQPACSEALRSVASEGCESSCCLHAPSQDNSSTGRGAFPGSLKRRAVAGGVTELAAVSPHCDFASPSCSREGRQGFKSCLAFHVTPPLFGLPAHTATHRSEIKMCEVRQGALSPVQIPSPL